MCLTVEGFLNKAFQNAISLTEQNFQVGFPQFFNKIHIEFPKRLLIKLMEEEFHGCAIIPTVLGRKYTILFKDLNGIVGIRCLRNSGILKNRHQYLRIYLRTIRMVKIHILIQLAHNLAQIRQRVCLRKRIEFGCHVIGNEFSPNGIANIQKMISRIVTHFYF